MANNYSDSTGVLVLNKVTPVINALFGPLELDASYPGNGQAYIASMSESTSGSWETIKENLEELANELSLALPDDAEDTIEEYLYLLASHFGADGNEQLEGIIDMTDFDNDADFASLFQIARAMNDGHGLSAYKVETAFHCSKPRLGEFGGSGEYAGTQLAVAENTSRITALGEKLEEALVAKDAAKAALEVHRHINQILVGIYDSATREAVTKKLANILAEGAEA